MKSYRSRLFVLLASVILASLICQLAVAANQYDDSLFKGMKWATSPRAGRQ